MTSNTSVLCGPVDPRIDDLLDELDRHGAVNVPDPAEDPIDSLVCAVHDLLLLEQQISAECVELAAENIILRSA